MAGCNRDDALGGLQFRKYVCLQGERPGFDPWVGKIPWKRKWQPTPVLPGNFHGQRSLVEYSAWGHKELDTAEHSAAASDCHMTE